MEVNPLSVILVKSDSKGDRLLFRYPFSSDSKTINHQKFNKKNPYALIVNEDSMQSSFPLTSNVVKGTLTGLTDEVLSKLFAVKPELYERKFELKVNDVRFVGHPTLYHSVNTDRADKHAGKNQRLNGTCAHSDTPSTILINTVFALHSYANHSIVKCYYDLSKRIGTALKHEEKRCGYVSKQTKEMIAAHDEVAQKSVITKIQNYSPHLTFSAEEVNKLTAFEHIRLADAGGSCESPFELILNRSSLAKDLKKVFDDLCSTGLVHIRINRWIEVSFCLPHKVHQTSYIRNGCLMEPAVIDRSLESIRPYHGLLLLVDPRELFESSPPDSSPALLRLIQVYSPLKSFQTLAADADITLTHIFQLTGHLVYWAQAMVIYPLCGSNVYVVAPDAPIHLNSPLVEKFSEKFPGESLIQLASDFSLPVSLSQKLTPLIPHEEQRQLIHMIAWMLQHRLLVQLHTYVHLMPSAEGHPESENAKRLGAALTPHSATEFCDQFNEVMEVHRVKNEIISHPSVCDAFFSSLDGEKKSLIDKLLLEHFNQEEREKILKIPASSNLNDLFLLINLFEKGYLSGKHHLEEIMYSMNIKRCTLLQILDKFREVLVTCEIEDPAISIFYSFYPISR